MILLIYTYKPDMAIKFGHYTLQFMLVSYFIIYCIWFYFILCQRTNIVTKWIIPCTISIVLFLLLVYTLGPFNDSRFQKKHIQDIENMTIYHIERDKNQTILRARMHEYGSLKKIIVNNPDISIHVGEKIESWYDLTQK